MIRIERDGLYSRTDLAELLKPFGLDVDTWTARLKPRKVFKSLWLGEDLLDALKAAPALGDPQPLPRARNGGNGKRRKGVGKHHITMEEVLRP